MIQCLLCDYGLNIGHLVPMYRLKYIFTNHAAALSDDHLEIMVFSFDVQFWR